MKINNFMPCCKIQQEKNGLQHNRKSRILFAMTGGFTLAEVLITISILGVVAVLTIPNITYKIQDMQQISTLKRAVSTIDNALYQLYIDEGFPTTWSTYDKNTLIDKISKYLNVKEICNAPADIRGNKCAEHPAKYKTLYGDAIGVSRFFSSKIIVTKQGFMYSFEHLYRDYFRINQGWSEATINNRVATTEPILGTILIDINGKKSPNRVGYDLFMFTYTPSGILITNKEPYRISWQPLITMAYEYCTGNGHNGSYGYMSDNGISCGNYVMKYNNMKYKYKDLTREEYYK